MTFKYIHDCSQCKASDKNPFCSSRKELRKLVVDSKEDLVLNRGQQIQIEDLKKGYLFMIRSGVLKKWLRFEDSESLTLLYPGQFLGCPSGHGAHDHKLLISAAEETHLCALSPDHVVELLKIDSQLLLDYLSNLQGKINDLRIAAASTSADNAKLRCATLLLDDFKARGQVLRGRLTVTKILSQSEWAMILKVRRETVSRIFQMFTQVGAITISHGSIILENEAKLLSIIANIAA